MDLYVKPAVVRQYNDLATSVNHYVRYTELLSAALQSNETKK